MNKARKIWLNYALGAAISALLIAVIYFQLRHHANKFDIREIWAQANPRYLIICCILMPLNLALEAVKWRLLAYSATNISYKAALKSVVAGISISIITPNRIGEYPGRIMYLREKNTFRLVSVSVLGIMAQMLTMFLYGLAGLLFYNLHFTGIMPVLALAFCLLMTIAIAALYMSFEKWGPYIERTKWLRRFNIYGQLLRRFSGRQQLTILSISVLRYSIYTAQYLVLLRWMNIDLPLIDGFFMSALFFWTIAVVPNVALAELPQRGEIALLLFGHFTGNMVGVLAATAGIWVINLIIPSLAGSLLVLRMRFFK